MKILLINHLYPEGGGAEAAVRGLVEFLKVQGHEVAVLTLGNDSMKSGMSCREEGGVQIYSYKTLSRRFSEKLVVCQFSRGNIGKRVFFRAGAFFCDWLSSNGSLKAMRLIRNIKPDVVHTHNVRGMGMLLPLFIRFGKGKARWVHTLHDIQLVYPSGLAIYPRLRKDSTNASKIFNRKNLKPFELCRKIYELLQKLIWGSPDVAVSPSDFLKKFYADRGFFRKSRHEVIPNVIMRKVDGSGDRGSERDSVLFIGALEESKGIQILLGAAQRQEQEFMKRSFTIDVVGDGSLRRQLADKYARFPWIRFHGALRAEALAHFYVRALVTVIPSLTLENAPMAILESLHFGALVVASRIGGILEYVKEGETGWLFTPGSVDELAGLLQKIINEGVSEEISRNCQRVSVDMGVRAYAGHAALYDSS